EKSPPEKNPPEKNSSETSPPAKQSDSTSKPSPPTPSDAKPAATRLPVPDTAAQQQSLARVKDLLKEDYAQAKGSEGQLNLARKLAKLAADEARNDQTACYVMATQALELATKYCESKFASVLAGGL